MCPCSRQPGNRRLTGGHASVTREKIAEFRYLHKPNRIPADCQRLEVSIAALNFFGLIAAESVGESVKAFQSAIIPSRYFRRISSGHRP
jgi:hypothetical protein